MSKPVGVPASPRVLAFAVVAALALSVAACGSAGGGQHARRAKAVYGTALYGTLPSAGAPRPGGRVTVGQITGNTPAYIFPILPPSDTSAPNLNLVGNLFMPLYNIAGGASPTIDYRLSVANPPRFSDGDKQVTIPLKHGLKWANGAPVIANDVLFDIDLLKAAVKESAASWGGYVPGLFPDSVISATAPDKYTVILRLDKAFNPGYFLNDQLQQINIGVYPLPSTDWNVAASGGPHLSDWSNPSVAKKIYDYLAKAGGKLSTFTSNPLWRDVDGPFRLKDFSLTNGSFDLVPNNRYDLTPKPCAAEISYQTFTSATAEVTAMKVGTLDIDPNFDTTQLGEVPSLRQTGIVVFGTPDFAWQGGVINFKDKTAHFDKVIAQLYVRRAIVHLIDQPALITGIYKNAAVPAYGPVPSEPRSPYAPTHAGRDPYPYRPAAAVSLLKSHGWKVVPGGQTTCADAGSGAGKCGAGIPAGTPLKFTWATVPQSEQAAGVLASEAIASIAKQAAGINITIQTKSQEFMNENYNDQNPAARQYTDDWGVTNTSVSNLYFPTQEGVDNSGGPYNLGGYEDPIANRLMRTSTSSRNVSAVKAEAAYLETHPPVFYLPDQDNLDAVSNKVGGDTGSWLALTQFFQLPQFWYVKK